MSSVIANALRMVFPRYPSRRFLVGRLGDERDYQWFVGNGSESPLVDACLSFIIGGFTQMTPVVAKSQPDDIDSSEILAGHDAAVLFRRPTYDPDLERSWYSWMTMMAGLIVSYCVDGNAYMLKVRSKAGAVVQLWYVPHFMLEPRWDVSQPGRFITGYDYAPDGTALTEGPTSVAVADGRGPVFSLRPQDVIHLRDGLDLQNPRKGRSKVKKILREIYTDEEAARWTASLLRNQGVPGLIISPDSDKYTVDKTDAEEIKGRLRADFSGDRRGEPIVMRGKTKVEQYGFNPEQMKLREIRALPEERIAAALGVAASVVGFGAGLEGVKVGRTLAEHVDLSWQNGILSRSRPIAAEFTEQYLSEFEDDAAVTYHFLFDTRRVPIMADFHKAEAERHDVLFNGGIEDRGEARKAVGLPVSARDRTFILRSGNVEVPSDQSMDDAPAAPTGPAPAAEPSSRNGNGKGSSDDEGDDVALKDTVRIA